MAAVDEEAENMIGLTTLYGIWKVADEADDKADGKIEGTAADPTGEAKEIDEVVSEVEDMSGDIMSDRVDDMVVGEGLNNAVVTTTVDVVGRGNAVLEARKSNSVS